MATDPALEMLRMFTTKIRVASSGQLVSADPKWTKTSLDRSVKSGLLCRADVTVVIPKSTTPLCSWRPADAKPELGAMAWQGRCRLRRGRPVQTTIYWATQRAAQTVGGVGGRLRQPWQVQHDLGVAGFYLALHQGSPETAKQWMGEDVYRLRYGRRGEKVADGFLFDDAERLVRVMEFIGDYPKRRLEDFHKYWSRRRIAYELI